MNAPRSFFPQQSTAPAASWAVCKRILSVHPGIYLSALLATWLVLLSCNYLARENDMHITAQRIAAEQNVQEAKSKQQHPWGSPRLESDSVVKPSQAVHVATNPVASRSKTSAKAFSSRKIETAKSAPAVWRQFAHVFQPAPSAPPKPDSYKRSKYGMVPPPPPIAAGLVPPPPPTVPIPMSMLSQPSPFFGQNISASQPIPAGPGAAAATTPYYTPELFTQPAYPPAVPPAGADALYATAAGDGGFKVIRHRQRKRTIAYR